MSNNYKQHNECSLQAYCHYPLILAEQEFEDSHKDKYRITTINWTYATNKENGEVDYEHVYKNIYKMGLGEFLQWFLEISNEEVAEKVVSIEKIEK